MTRSAFAPALAVMLSAALAPAVFAQAKPSTPPAAQPSAQAAQAPAARAKWVQPVKGIAKIQVIRGNPKPVGKEVWTVLKIKNMSAGSIALLRIDEYWYDTSRNMVTGDTYRHRQPLNPGEILEITMKSPIKPNLTSSRIQFEHANGKVDVLGVKAFK
jgi:hypothetical protein